MFRRSLAVVIATFALTQHAIAQELTEMSLEDLLVTEVSSVAKKRQKASEAPAAVYVISQEDIRRSGESTIPGLLRMAPGVEVAELDANVTAVTIRGFNSRFSNKLLVLIDGRSVYFPSFAGVLWDQFPMAVEDIERIEIVRGPGAAVWGANAVNGVINIITKHGIDTQGTLASIRADSEGGVTAYGRQGVRTGDASTLRLFAKTLRDSSLTDVDGREINDGLKSISAGFRYDVEPNVQDAFTLQGEVQAGDFDSTTMIGLVSAFSTIEEEHSQYNLLGRWTRRLGGSDQMTLQTYLDHVERTEVGIDLKRSTFDIDYSQSAALGSSHELVWGMGYRWASDDLVGVGAIVFDPAESTEVVWSGFLQDELSLLDDRFALTAGVRVEHNDHTGVEVQPSVRGIWKDPDGWALWGAVSRAVRTPARFERDADVGFQFFAPMTPENPGPLPMQLIVTGAEDLESEVLIAYEVGWRRDFSADSSLDVTAFYHDYDQALAFFPTSPVLVGTPFPNLVQLPLLQANIATLGAKGAEITYGTRLTPSWTIDLATSVLDLNADVPGTIPGIQSVSLDNLSPNWQASIRSAYDITDSVEFDLWVKHVAELKNGPTSDYTDLDIKLSWRPKANIELYLKGDNLLTERRAEFHWEGYPAPDGYVERKAEVGLSVRF